MKFFTTDSDVAAQSSPQTQMAVVMAGTNKPYYQGTVDPAVKARRRAANKVARKSRRANRAN